MPEITHPGRFIKQWLRDNEKSQAFLAGAMGFQEPFVSKIVNGKAHVSPVIALKLEAVTQVPASTWMRYETDYLLSRERARIHYE